MKRFFLLTMLVLAGVLAGSSSAIACDRSYAVFDSVRFNGTNYEIHFTMCFGSGRTGTQSGADQQTNTFGFDLYTSCTATSVVNVEQDTVCPAFILAGSTGCFRHSATFCGASIPVSQNRGQDCWIRYNAVTLGEFFTCISSTSACGDTQTFCRQFYFETDCYVDSVVVTGMEGAANQTNSCWASDHNEQVIAAPILPILWGSFIGTPAADGITLDWVTYTENGTDHFKVYHSTNGLDFFEIGTKNALGTVTKEWNSYQYFDPNPSRGVNFYMLVQVDLYGGTEQSEVIQVNYNGPQAVSIYSVSPVPSDNFVNIVYLSDDQYDFTIEVFDIKGARMATYNTTGYTGSNQMMLDISGYTSGIYMVRLTGGGTQLETKIVRM